MQILIEIDEARAHVLEEIKENAGLRSYRELFDNSLTLLDWAIKQRAAGRIVAALDKANHSYRELAIDVLNRVRRSPRGRNEASRHD